jgi:hypothetical protein
MLIELQKLGVKLWQDECGAVLSAEAVLVATLGVAGAAVGMDAVSKSVNDELKDYAFAIRSLDQSFSLKSRRSEGVTLAGSSFQQASVEESHAAMRKQIAESEARQEQQLKDLQRERRRHRDEEDE